jgi:hypothetical protein
MRMRVTTAALLGLALAWATPAAAWHNDGHMAVARIAWKQLDDRQRTRVAGILKAHPHYDGFLTVDRPEGLPAVEWAFVQAAIWPDWVRAPVAPNLSADDRDAIVKEFNKPVWHYVNLPYVHPDDAGRFDAAAIRKEILTPEVDDKGEPRHVLAALKRCVQKLQAGDTPDKEKAVYLCWLLHLVGDLHQPLHGTSLIASKAVFDPPLEPPHGDEGGNRLAVKAKAGDAKAVKLHFYWDALLFADQPAFPAVDAVVANWLNDARYRRDKLPELKATEFLAWAEESLEAAKTVVYKGGDGFLKARPLPGRRVELEGLDAPVLPDGYQKAAEEVARRRMMLAGYRLADQIRATLKVE